MNFDQSLKIKPISSIRKPNEYVVSLLGEFSEWAYTESTAPEFKGKWRTQAFKADHNIPLDLELGSGNGLFFAHQSYQHPDRCLIGIERKFKPLIQSIRRARKNESTNARMVRYDAEVPWGLFSEKELNDIYIQFPDPWEKRRWQKNRLIQVEFLEKLIRLQQSGGILEFKTDHRDYFDHALKVFKQSSYKLVGYSYDLHNSEYVESNFVTQFEKIFLEKGQPIHFATLIVE